MLIDLKRKRPPIVKQRILAGQALTCGVDHQVHPTTPSGALLQSGHGYSLAGVVEII